MTTTQKDRTSATGGINRTVSAKLSDEVSVFDFMTPTQIADVQAQTKSIDVTTAVQAAVTAAIAAGKRKVYFPAGWYLLNGGTASPDGFKNGILLPLQSVNFNPKEGIMLHGDGGSTVFYAGSNSMVLCRISRNCVTLRDIGFDGNGKTNAWGVGIVPEDMTQNVSIGSQSFTTLDNVSTENLTEGIVIQPGPTVAGADSGCFYTNVIGGFGNFNTRHVYLKKPVGWAVNNNRPTRTIFMGYRCLRGNTGYDFEVGTEVELYGCHEELIASGTSPSATPTARKVSADCANIHYFGGYSEACTRATDTAANGIVTSYSYIPASAPDANQFRSNVRSFGDTYLENVELTDITLSSSGGGAQGASTSTGWCTRQGKLATIYINLSVAKGTLVAGNLSIGAGTIPFAAKSGTLQGIPVTSYSGITLTAPHTHVGAYLSGTTISLRKMRIDGASPGNLTLEECADPIVITLQGSYITQ